MEAAAGAALLNGGDAVAYTVCLWIMYLMVPFNIISLRFVTAPYGKHFRQGYGPAIPAPVAWFLMESPTLWLTFLLYPYGRRRRSDPFTLLLLLAPFLLHYLHRAIVYPLRLRRHPAAKPLPLTVVLSAFSFCALNAYVQTRSISHFADERHRDNFVRVSAGLAVFGWGMWVNVTSDAALLQLKRESGGAYRIPRGGWFEWVTCPNYMGEAAEWLGWTIMNDSSPASLAFFLFTCSNLFPRAVATRNWYVLKFGHDFPNRRKAVVPFLL